MPTRRSILQALLGTAALRKSVQADVPLPTEIPEPIEEIQVEPVREYRSAMSDWVNTPPHLRGNRAQFVDNWAYQNLDPMLATSVQKAPSEVDPDIEVSEHLKDPNVRLAGVIKAYEGKKDG